MTSSYRVAMLGAGLIADHYAAAIHARRSIDKVRIVYSRSAERAELFTTRHGVAQWTTDLEAAISHPDVDVVVVALPNDQHLPAVELATAAGKAVLCTKPLARTPQEAMRMLDAVESSGVFAGYLEDLVYTPKSLAAISAVRAGAVGQIVSVRTREAHAGPHSAWFLLSENAGGGALLDLGTHCVELIRSYVGKHDMPTEVVCWTDTRRADTSLDDNAFALIRFASGAVGQVDVSWTARGGMDLRDEINGMNGTIRLDHFHHTGFEMFTMEDDVVEVEKSDGAGGWQFPVADELTATGNLDMFADMFTAMDEGREPRETFFDGYVVNAVLDACYRSARSGRSEKVVLAR